MTTSEKIKTNLTELIEFYERLAEFGPKPGLGGWAEKRLPILRVALEKRNGI